MLIQAFKVFIHECIVDIAELLGLFDFNIGMFFKIFCSGILVKITW